MATEAEEASRQLLAATYDKDEKIILVRRLLKVPGINVNIQTKEGSTPLRFATNNGHINIVKMLLEKGAKIELENDTLGTVLNFAVFKSNKELIKLLLKSGANVNKLTNDGVTPLMVSLKSKDIDITKMLIENGADINVTSTGSTVLDLSIKNGRLDIIDLLLKYDIDINKTNPLITAILTLTKFNPKSLAVAEILNEVLKKSNNSNTNSYNSNNNSEHSNININEAHNFIQDYYLTIVKMLLTHPNININNQTDNLTPFTLAILLNEIDIIRLFLEHHKGDELRQLHINKQDTFGFTPLMRAVRRTLLDIIKLLLNDDRTQQNIVNNDGLTAYLIAAVEGYVEVIQAFHEDTVVAHGALEGPIEFVPPPNVEPSTLMEGKTNQGMIDIPDNTFDIFTQGPITEGQLVVRIHQLKHDFFLLDEWTKYINKYSSRNKSNQIINPANRQPVTPDQVDIFTAHIVPEKDEPPILKYNTSGGYRHTMRRRHRI